LEFHVNYINRNIIFDTFYNILLIEDCWEKFDIMMCFLRKYGLEYMIYQWATRLLDTAIKYNRLNMIKNLINIIKNNNELYKLQYCYEHINNLNTFKYIIFNDDKNINKHIYYILFHMLIKKNIRIVKYILKNYKLNDFKKIYDNSNMDCHKYYNNIGFIYSYMNDIIFI